MPFVASGPAVILRASVWFALFVAAFHGAGALVVGGTLPRRSATDAALYHAFSVSIGTVLFSTFVFVLGLAGILKTPFLAAFVAAGTAAAWRDKRAHGAQERAALSSFWKSLPAAGRFALSALLCLAALSFVAAQAPEAGNDSMAYHLYFPELHALSGRLVHDPLHPRSLWPSFMGMLFTAGLMLQGVALAKLFSWMTLALAVLALAGFSAAHGRRAAAWATALFALVPALWQQSLFAYTDLAILLFAFLSFAALCEWEERGYRARNGLVAGLALAGLLSIKFSTIAPALFFGALFGGALVARPRISARAKASAIGVVAGSAALFSGFWYVRSWILTGNPVFPFLYKVFGSGFPQGMVGWALLPKTALNFALLPWNLATRVDTFGGEPMGAMFLAALPFLVFFPARDRRARLAAAFCAFYVVAWFWSVQHIRFLLPVLPFFAFALGASAARARSEGRGRLASWVLAALGAVQFALAAHYPARLLKPALGVVPAARYLRDNERSFAFMEKVARTVAPGERVLFMDEPRLFYAPPGSIAMSPIVELECARRGVGLDRWLADNGVRYVATADEGAFKEPPVRAERVADAVTRESGRTFYHALWRTA